MNMCALYLECKETKIMILVVGSTRRSQRREGLLAGADFPTYRGG